MHKYRVFKSLIKPQPPHPYIDAGGEYRVFKSLIKPQPRIVTFQTEKQYRVFKSLIKPQLIELSLKLRCSLSCLKA